MFSDNTVQSAVSVENILRIPELVAKNYYTQ